FDERVERTLRGLDEPLTPRMNWRCVLIAAALCAAVLGGAALAARGFGIFDVVNAFETELTEPGLTEDEMQALVQTPSLALNTANVAFTLDEALFDGRNMYATVTARARDPQGTLLMSDYCTDVNDPAPGSPEGAAETFAQRARREGRRIVKVGVSFAGENDDAISGYFEHYNDDGSVTLCANVMLSESVRGALDIECRAWETDESGLGREVMSASLNISANIPIETARAQGEYALREATVTGITVSRSRVGAYVDIEGRFGGEVQHGWDSLTIRVLGADGGNDIVQGGGFWFCDAEGGHCDAPVPDGSFALKAQLPAGEALPTELRLELYDYEKCEALAGVTVPLAGDKGEE
ncbi:MAG: hypothetical protein ACI4L8_12370, partial [Candidatus Fimadaptatus sp.]